MTFKELIKLRTTYGRELNVLNWNYNSNWELPTDQRATPEEQARYEFLTRELMIIREKMEAIRLGSYYSHFGVTIPRKN